MQAAYERFQAALAAHMRVLATRAHDAEFIWVSEICVLTAARLLLLEAQNQLKCAQQS